MCTIVKGLETSFSVTVFPSYISELCLLFKPEILLNPNQIIKVVTSKMGKNKILPRKEILCNGLLILNGSFAVLLAGFINWRNLLYTGTI